MTPDEFHGDWNDSIQPEKRKSGGYSDETPEATQRCDSRSCQNNTPRAVRCRSTGKNVPTATAAAAPIFSITHRGRCDAGAPGKNVPTATAAAPVCGRRDVAPSASALRPAGRRLDRGATREPRGPTTHRPSLLVTPAPEGPESSSPTRSAFAGVTLQRRSMGHPAPEAPIATLTPWTGASARVQYELRRPERGRRRRGQGPSAKSRSSRSSWTRSNRSSYIPAFTPWSCFSRQRFWPSSRM